MKENNSVCVQERERVRVRDKKTELKKKQIIGGNFIPSNNSSISQENIFGCRWEHKKISQNVKKRKKKD